MSFFSLQAVRSSYSTIFRGGLHSLSSTPSYFGRSGQPFSNPHRIPTMNGRVSTVFQHVSKLNDSIFFSKFQKTRVLEKPKADSPVVKSGVSTSFWAAVLLALAVYESQKRDTPEEEALHNRLQPYFDLLKEHPDKLGPLGIAEQGEIEIVLDLKKIAEIEKMMGQRVGILAQNAWQIWINDAVKFPNGTYGIYLRIFPTQSLKGVAGAAVLPVMPDGKILLVCIYRHAEREWRMEIPRGIGEGQEVAMATAKRELKEETGMEVASVQLLGKMDPDSGVLSSSIPIFEAQIGKQGEARRDDGESSMTLKAFSRKEIEEGLAKGFIAVNVNGKMRDVPLRDSFLAYALLLSKIKAASQQKV
jgi:ADP-ribose pyrophosphatase YjhB (NUDIX family)